MDESTRRDLEAFAEEARRLTDDKRRRIAARQNELEHEHLAQAQADARRVLQEDETRANRLAEAEQLTEAAHVTDSPDFVTGEDLDPAEIREAQEVTSRVHDAMDNAALALVTKDRIGAGHYRLLRAAWEAGVGTHGQQPPSNQTGQHDADFPA